MSLVGRGGASDGARVARRYADEGLGGRPIGARGRCRVRIRWPPTLRRGSWRCAGRTRAGERARSSSGWVAPACRRCRRGRRWTAVCPSPADDPKTRRRSGRTTSVGSAAGDGALADGHHVGRAPAGRHRAVDRDGIDDHSRFCVSAKVVERATARPVCDALLEAMRRHGVPGRSSPTTARSSPGVSGRARSGVVRPHLPPDGIRHLLTAPASPTTTGKVERFHKTLKREFLDGKVFASIAEAQAADRRVGATTTTTSGPHQ